MYIGKFDVIPEVTEAMFIFLAFFFFQIVYFLLISCLFVSAGFLLLLDFSLVAMRGCYSLVAVHELLIAMISLTPKCRL